MRTALEKMVENGEVTTGTAPDNGETLFNGGFSEPTAYCQFTCTQHPADEIFVLADGYQIHRDQWQKICDLVEKMQDAAHFIEAHFLGNYLLPEEKELNRLYATVESVRKFFAN